LFFQFIIIEETKRIWFHKYTDQMGCNIISDNIMISMMVLYIMCAIGNHWNPIFVSRDRRPRQQTRRHHRRRGRVDTMSVINIVCASLKQLSGVVDHMCVRVARAWRHIIYILALIKCVLSNNIHAKRKLYYKCVPAVDGHIIHRSTRHTCSCTL